MLFQPCRQKKKKKETGDSTPETCDVRKAETAAFGISSPQRVLFRETVNWTYVVEIMVLERPDIVLRRSGTLKNVVIFLD